MCCPWSRDQYVGSGYNQQIDDKVGSSHTLTGSIRVIKMEPEEVLLSMGLTFFSQSNSGFG